ncbi:MAG: protein phosphatase 2C domain-containing protein [Azoarcus sp.]|nr:protein phosphatase 2C domain-containing protein [Azoarcus sp.]
MDLQTAYISRIGRRKRNEDACGYWTSEQGCCWVVSDGAGGHGSGDRAAQIVVSTVLERFAANPEVSETHAVALLEAAHAEVMAEKRANPEGDNMHATAALLLIDAVRQEAVWSHVGDTRIYLFGHGQMLHQTRDHSLVQGMIDAGYGDLDMIRSHPQRSLLTSAIGHADDLTLSVSGAPLHIGADDTFLICTDGWWEYIDEARMMTELHAATSCTDWLKRMADIVGAHDNPHSDNYTAVAVRGAAAENETTILMP